MSKRQRLSLASAASFPRGNRFGCVAPGSHGRLKGEPNLLFKTEIPGIRLFLYRSDFYLYWPQALKLRLPIAAILQIRKSRDVVSFAEYAQAVQIFVCRFERFVRDSCRSRLAEALSQLLHQLRGSLRRRLLHDKSLAEIVLADVAALEQAQSQDAFGNQSCRSEVFFRETSPALQATRSVRKGSFR